jgi:chain length determinant protein tyrosine kinase EpsG
MAREIPFPAPAAAGLTIYRGTRMATVIRKERDRDWPATRAGAIGELLMRAGKLDEAAVARVLATQRESGQRFGEVAVALGLLQEDDVQRALARQFDYASIGAADSPLDDSLYAARESSGARLEALRRLRSELKLRCFQAEPRPLAVLAPRAGPDTSAMAGNLALSFAQIGERTLLVDANLRDPRQHQLFGLPPREGLSNLLVGRLPLAEAPLPVAGFPNLSVLCAGAPVPNPHELLSRDSLASLMEAVAVNFDIVIVDCPPALEFADAQRIAACCGSCLLVARRDDTRIGDIEAVKAQLAPTGTPLVGAVMTRR